MLPTQIIRNHAGEFQEDELNQLLVSLYRTFQEQTEDQERQLPRPPLEQRMKRFETWLDRVLTQGESKQTETLRINHFFQKELPELQKIWERTREKISAAQEAARG